MSRIKIIIAIIILIVLLAVFIPGYSRLQKLNNLNQDLTGRIEKLKIENTRLTEELDRLKQDPLYLEEIARKKMPLSKKGEVIYKITP